MKIVIDIPEERYEFIKGLDNTCYDIHAAIAQGIPLPKGHGDLIDKDEFFQEFPELNIEPYVNAPIVIPADDGE